MTCVDFDRHWNELLDARGPGPTDLERRLDAHAATCEACRGVATRYRVLRQAIGSLGPPPTPSAASTARLLARIEARRTSRGRPVRYAWVPLAAAAALLAIVRPPGLGRPDGDRPKGEVGRPEARRPLDSALAEATHASIELALEASAPAARIGREVLGDLERSGGSAPARARLDGLTPQPSAAIQLVGERLQAGVRPISGSARHAFGFLLGPPSAPPPPDRL